MVIKYNNLDKVDIGRNQLKEEIKELLIQRLNKVDINIDSLSEDELKVCLKDIIKYIK